MDGSTQYSMADNKLSMWWNAAFGSLVFEKNFGKVLTNNILFVIFVAEEYLPLI